MALTLTQEPGSLSFAQSPIIYTVSDSNAESFTSSSYQYMLDLYYWTGSLTASGSSPNYTLQKYPNPSSVGIFDVSRILNSALSDLRAENSASVMWYTVEAYSQYKTSSTGSFVTSSHVTNETYGAIDGYQLFQQPLQTSTIEFHELASDYFPLMTDGPVSQSFNSGDTGRISICQIDEPSYDVADRVVYRNNLNGTTGSVAVSAFNGNSSTFIQTIPFVPGEGDFPLGSSVVDYTILPYYGNTILGDGITMVQDCEKKYPPVRIAWKNRYGQYDYFNFNLVSRESFNTERSRYQPQIGTWSSPTLTYNDYDSSIQNYITDSTLKISVNTDYISEDYNEIFKQLMVSDEIYWLYDQTNNLVKPLAMDTSTFNIKTNVVDKLIQYSFDFTQGQGFKLVF